MQSNPKHDRVRLLWKTHTISQIADDIGTTRSAVWTLAKKLDLPKKSLLAEEAERPTADEIEERSAEVRSRWSPSEMRRRRVGGHEDYRIPCLTNRQVFPTFQGQGRF